MEREPPRDVVEFIHGTAWERLPAAVQRQSVRCLLDTVGAGIGGRVTPLSQIVHDFAVETFGGRGGRLWEDGREVSPAGAALANGMTVDALDVHDGHSLTKGHAGAAVVPAALATLPADEVVSGRELLTSLAVGYEIALRAGISQHMTAPDYHSSGSWNALGCAALTARRLRLSPEATRHALGIAEYHGPRSQMMRCVDAPTMLKDGSGWGAMAGVSAARLAARGFTGAPAVTIADPTRSFTDYLEQGWQFLQQYFKPHAVCRWAQPAVEGALRLKRRHGLSADEIAKITVETFHEATRLAVRRPANTEEAQYSLPFPVAAALVWGELGPDQLTGPALCDEGVLRLAEGLELKENRELSRWFPSRRLAHVIIRTTDGRRLGARNVEPTWEAARPPGDEELIAKFRRLAGRLPGQRAERLEELLLDCAVLTDARAIVEELSRPA